MLKIAYIGSNPAANSGFGVVSRHILKHLHHKGCDIACLGYMEDLNHFDGSLYDYAVEPVLFEKTLEKDLLKDFCRRHKPDVILLHDEINVCKWWFDLLKENPAEHTPVICYLPIYGEPIAYAFISFLQKLQGIIAYTDFGRKVIEKYVHCKAHFAHLGVDHTVFYPFEAPLRRRMREYLGWQDKFVVMFVSRNRLNKQHTKLIKAIAMMKKMKYDQLLCYIHCNPTEALTIYGGGVDLTRWVRHVNLEDTVLFPEEMETQEKGISLMDEEVDFQSPAAGGAVEKLRKFGLPSRYNLADFYIHPTLMEGFGLPLVEAMATGLPLAHTDDGGAMNEITGKSGFRMKPVRKERDAVGTICHSVTTAAVFGTLKKFSQDFVEGKRGQERSGRNLKRSQLFSWEKTAENMLEIIKACLERGRRGRKP